jgi:hypothetical protein
MKVYLTGEKARRQPVFFMSVAPAATVSNHEVPAHWVDDQNKPVQFNIEFAFGEAEVEDSIARYLLEHELVKKSKLLLPPLPTLEVPGGDQISLFTEGG